MIDTLLEISYDWDIPVSTKSNGVDFMERNKDNCAIHCSTDEEFICFYDTFVNLGYKFIDLEPLRDTWSFSKDEICFDIYHTSKSKYVDWAYKSYYTEDEKRTVYEFSDFDWEV